MPNRSYPVHEFTGDGRRRKNNAMVDCGVMVANMVLHANAEWANSEREFAAVPRADDGRSGRKIGTGKNLANVQAPSFKLGGSNSVRAVADWKESVENVPAWRAASGDGKSAVALTEWARYACSVLLPPGSDGYWRTVNTATWKLKRVTEWPVQTDLMAEN